MWPESWVGLVDLILDGGRCDIRVEPPVAKLQQSLGPGCTVLVKGSRCMKMDEGVLALLSRRMRGNQGTSGVNPRRAEVIKK